MRKTILAISIATISISAMAGGGKSKGGYDIDIGINPKANATAQQGQLQGQLQGQSQNALSGSVSDSKSEAVSTSRSNSASLSGAYSGSQSHSGDSLSGAYTGDNSLSLYQQYSNKYPDIPVEAGFTFAGRCQEGSSATNAKLSIALTTDSSFCDRLSLADNYYQMVKYSSKACLAELKSYQTERMHAEFVASQTKGKRIIPEYEIDPVPASCLDADDYHERMALQLSKAQDMLDKTEQTGLIAKWATQLGIPVSVLYVLISVL